MAANHAIKVGLNFQLPDNGPGTARVGGLDAAGQPTTMFPPGMTVPAWTSSDPAITLAPAADGMSAVMTPHAVKTNVMITVTATAPGPPAVTLTGSDEIDVTGTVATGFKLSESVP